MPPLGGRTVLVGGRNIRRPRAGGCAYGNGSGWHQRGASDPGGRRGSYRSGRSHVGDLGNARKCGRRGPGRSHLPAAFYCARSGAPGQCQPTVGKLLVGRSSAISGCWGTRKSALSENAQDASGSPPPELPNHVMILCPVGPPVNVTSVTSCVDKSTPGIRTRSNWGNCVWKLLFLRKQKG